MAFTISKEDFDEVLKQPAVPNSQRIIQDAFQALNTGEKVIIQQTLERHEPADLQVFEKKEQLESALCSPRIVNTKDFQWEAFARTVLDSGRELYLTNLDECDVDRCNKLAEEAEMKFEYLKEKLTGVFRVPRS